MTRAETWLLFACWGVILLGAVVILWRLKGHL
jgi:hypothetical protein